MKFFKTILFFLACAVLMISVTYASPANDSLNQRLTNIRSMKADFTQTLKDNHGKTIQTSRGWMALQRPGEFRWQTLTPNKQLVVANGSRLWIYDPDLEQVIVRALSKQAGETPALLLSDANPSLEKDFAVSADNTASSGMQSYVLSPKDRGSMFTSIRMEFTGNELHEMQLRDHLDHITTIEFKNVKTNTKLPNAMFYFAPPKNVDIIDETKQRSI